MDFVEDIRVGKERAQTGIGAKQDGPSAIFSTWIIRRICIAEDTSTQGDELERIGFLFTVHRIGNVGHKGNFEITSLRSQ